MPGKEETDLENIGKRSKHTYDERKYHNNGKKVQKFFLVSFGHEFHYTLD